jgi:anti-sigma B factor antagonist
VSTPVSFVSKVLPTIPVRAIIAAHEFPMALSVTVRHADNVAVLVLNGRLTIGESVGILHNAVEERFEAGDKDVVVDMRDVGYVDSSGLGGLVTCLTCARNHGGTFRLANVTQRVQDLLDVSTLYMVFQIIELASSKVDE